MSTFVHDTAVVDEGAQIGEGTKVWHFSHVMTGARIGRNVVVGQNCFVASGATVGDGCHIQNNVSVYAGVTLESDVFCGPSMVFTNVSTPRAAVDRRGEFENTLVARGASLGANCTVLCGCTIGEHALVAAGAVVTKDVPAYRLVLGIPARPAGWVCKCGELLGLAVNAQPGTEVLCIRCAARYEVARGDTLVIR